MAIEPLGSIMSVQAQTMTAPKPVAQTKPQNSEPQSNTAQEAAQVDNTVNVVAEGQSKGNAGGNSGEQQQQQLSNEQLRRAVEQLNKNMVAHSEAVFGIHEGTNRVTIKIVDKDTKEVLKELPPEKTLDMIAKVWEMAGILVDERR
ncbi:MAG: flagellar protein FlaG [bacterium]|nr:flagellar protein FlaG [bacterium]MCM1376081.1 flagellar protein FlaG [Muribaculum sp.]